MLSLVHSEETEYRAREIVGSEGAPTAGMEALALGHDGRSDQPIHAAPPSCEADAGGLQEAGIGNTGQSSANPPPISSGSAYHSSVDLPTCSASTTPTMTYGAEAHHLRCTCAQCVKAQA